MKLVKVIGNKTNLNFNHMIGKVGKCLDSYSNQGWTTATFDDGVYTLPNNCLRTVPRKRYWFTTKYFCEDLGDTIRNEFKGDILAYDKQEAKKQLLRVMEDLIDDHLGLSGE